LFDLLHPILRIGHLGDELQIADISTDGAVELMAKEQSSEGDVLTLPVFRQCFEANVLRKQNPAKGGRPPQQSVVG